MKRKKYSRAGLIKHFKALPPRSRPCRNGLCPIAVFVGMGTGDTPLLSANMKALDLDEVLADAMDHASDQDDDWSRLTAARIARIAESL